VDYRRAVRGGAFYFYCQRRIPSWRVLVRQPLFGRSGCSRGTYPWTGRAVPKRIGGSTFGGRGHPSRQHRDRRASPTREEGVRAWTRAECRRWLAQALRVDQPRSLIAMDFGFGYPWGARGSAFGSDGWEVMLGAVCSLYAEEGTARAVAQKINSSELRGARALPLQRHQDRLPLLPRQQNALLPPCRDGGPTGHKPVVPRLGRYGGLQHDHGDGSRGL
jgi:hypothetical protein